MKCSMHGANARVLHKILQNLAKIGSDLYLEAMTSGLSLRTAHSSQSSFAKVHLSETFFLEYHQQITPSDGSFETRCRVSFKSFLSVFRHIKQVEVCTLRLDENSCQLTIRMRCVEEKVRMLYVPILELETLDATMYRDNIPNKLMCLGSLFSNIMANFHAEKELTMDISKGVIVVKNYVDDRIVDKTVMRTRITLQPEEFQEYSITQETRLTFCLKSFRAFLSLAEAFNATSTITIEFETEGSPVLFKVVESTLDGSLLMSTLARHMYDNSIISTYDEAIHSEVLPNDSSMTRSQNKRQKPSPVEGRTSPVLSKRHKPEKPLQRSLTDSQIAVMDTQMDSRQDFHPSNSTPDDLLLRNPPAVVLDDPLTPKNASLPTSQNKEIVTESTPFSLVFQRDSEDTDGAKKSALDNTVVDAEEEESVPPSPPTEEDLKRMKARRIFKRCFEPTFHFSNRSIKTHVLAENSDSE